MFHNTATRACRLWLQQPGRLPLRKLRAPQPTAADTQAWKRAAPLAEAQVQGNQRVRPVCPPCNLRAERNLIQKHVSPSQPANIWHFQARKVSAALRAAVVVARYAT
jgi:hypothetical protein